MTMQGDAISPLLTAVPFVYLALQVGGLFARREPLRTGARICAGLMGAVVIFAVAGGLAGSNLAPIWVLFAIPVLTAALLVLWGVHLLRR
ncbi:MAG: hypothetical protein V2I65_16875 [Paracoccaceae bacterium]|nr:hypothetical protein [Paracoccaceae bacterium]